MPPTAAANGWRYSFRLPAVFGAQTAATGGCCPWSQTPMPARAGRKLPTLIGLGVHKAGTSFLYNLLKRHPRFAAPTAPQLWTSEKELMLFNTFPLQPHAFSQYLDSWPANATRAHYFEITASYLHVPAAACRMRELLPDARFVVMLRDPVDRALSHWNMQQQLWLAGLSSWKPPPFLQAVRREIAAYQHANCSFGTGETGSAKSWNDCFRCWMVPLHHAHVQSFCRNYEVHYDRDTPCSPTLNSGMFVGFGQYAAPIAWWFTFFHPSRFLFVHTDELKKNPLVVGNKIAKFMGTPEFTAEMVAGMGTSEGNEYPYQVDRDARDISTALQLLRQFYEKPNSDLYHLLHRVGVRDIPDLNSRSSTA